MNKNTEILPKTQNSKERKEADSPTKTENSKNIKHIKIKEKGIVRITYLLDDCFFECNKYMRLLGENFIENNRNKCSIIIAEKEYEIVSMIDMEEFDKYGINMKDETLKVILNGEKIKDMTQMFYDCKSLKEVDFSSFNSLNVTSMSLMFYCCDNLTKVNFSSFNTQNVTNMSWMFNGCYSLKKVNFSSFNTQNVTNMENMLAECSSLIKIDFSSFNIQNVKDMTSMFFGCEGLVKIKRKNLHKFKSGSELENSQLLIIEI